MGARRDRLDNRLAKATATRRKNSVIKTRERTRRDAKMAELLKRSDPPYIPAVMSWLSQKLDKPAKQITPDDVKSLVS